MIRKNKLTNWYIVTGSPCSGITTTVKELEKRGYRVIYELARQFIDQELKKGRTLAEIRKNELKFQQKILQFKIKTEKKLPKKEIIFFDRGISDSIAYYRICGLVKDEILKKAVRNSSYQKVFLLDKLPYKKDYARIENDQTRLKLYKYLKEGYEKIKTPVVKVPIMSVEKRVKFILKNLSYDNQN